MNWYNLAAPLRSLHLFFLYFNLFWPFPMHTFIHIHWKLHAGLSDVSQRLHIHLLGHNISVEHIFSRPTLKHIHTCHWAREFANSYHQKPSNCRTGGTKIRQWWLLLPFSQWTLCRVFCLLELSDHHWLWVSYLLQTANNMTPIRYSQNPISWVLAVKL